MNLVRSPSGTGQQPKQATVGRMVSATVPIMVDAPSDGVISLKDQTSNAVFRETNSRATAVEVFCGAGGMSLGFEAAGFDVLVAVDSNPIHVATHEWNFPQTHSLCADVKTLSAEDLIAAAKTRWIEKYPTESWEGDIDCLFGGPSCQGFSEIGRRNPSDERNDLLSGFAHLVSDIRPKYFVMENVPGLLAPLNKTVLDKTLKIFTDAKYSLVSGAPLILNAGNFGVPQHNGEYL